MRRIPTATVSDFVDMRVRGFAGESDQLFAPHLGEHVEEVLRWGFDFYEMYKVQETGQRARSLLDEWGMVLHPVRRPTAVPFDVTQYKLVHPDLWGFVPNKGWIESLEHFAHCFLTGQQPQNADAAAGALSTNTALSLLKSLATGQPVSLSGRSPLV